MTKLLEQAFKQVRNLPDDKQDAIAHLLLSELDSDRKWDERLAHHNPKLAHLADEAWEDYEAGRTQELDPDQL